MAERDRYEWERGRDYERDRGYGRGSDRERGYDDRGAMSRGADEVRSWFGDDEARRRREMDEQRDRERGWTDTGERDWRYGANSERARMEHGWGQSARPSDWERSRYQLGPTQDRSWEERSGITSPTYGFGAPNWSGAPSSGYGGRRDEHQSPSPHTYGGGYGAGSYESGSYRSGGFGREGGQTGEGRWSGQGGFGSFGGSWYGSGSSTSGSFAGRGPRGYQRSDERIREDVNERLTADPRIDASDIDVRVQNCEVTLSGSVDDRRTRRLAEEIIEDLPGVRDVKNDLRVQQSGWFGGGGDAGDRGQRQAAEQARAREDGSIGKTGDPQKREDVTTLNQTGKINR